MFVPLLRLRFVALVSAFLAAAGLDVDRVCTEPCPDWIVPKECAPAAGRDTPARCALDVDAKPKARIAINPNLSGLVMADRLYGYDAHRAFPVARAFYSFQRAAMQRKVTALNRP